MDSTLKQITIPLYGAWWALLTVPVPMSEENYQLLEKWVRLLKEPLIGYKGVHIKGEL